MIKYFNKIKVKMKTNTFLFIISLAILIYFISLIIIMIYKKIDFISAQIFILPSFMGSLANISKDIADLARLMCLAMYILILSAIISKISEKIIIFALK